MLTLAACGDPDDTDDELGKNHPASPKDEDLSSAKFLDNVKRDRCRADVDKGGDKRYQEGVFDCIKTLEENDAEVEDEVDTWSRISNRRATSMGSDGGVPVSCCIICMRMPTVVRRMLLFPLKIDPVKQLVQPPM